jgi:hypothetical protein
MTYDPNSDQFLVVWWKTGSNVITGQRVSSAGIPLGLNFAISDPGSQDFPAATFNTKANEFLVVWNTQAPPPREGGQHDIVGQRLNPAGGEVGPNDFVITGSQFQSAKHAAVTYDPNANQYQTVFQASTGTFESVFGQQLDATGTKIGDSFSISPTHNDEEARSVVYNTATCEYLVAWEHLFGTESRGKTEIFARRLGAPPCSRAAGGAGGTAAGGGNGGSGPNVVGTGGTGGNAGPCGGGGAGGGGLGAGGGGAGGGGCFNIVGVQSLAAGAVVASAGVATARTSVRAEVLAKLSGSRKARTSRLTLIGHKTMPGLPVGRYKVVVRLSDKARKAFKHLRKVKVTLRLVMTAPTGKPLKVTRTVTLKR